jgi:gliding motility-associated-like protein
MTAVNFYRVLLASFSCMITLCSISQPVTCPSNIDFEDGSFNGWECKVGVVTSSPGVNQINWVGSGELLNRHTIVDASSGLIDRFGLFPQSCPNGSGYSVRLGNDFSGAESEGISFTYDIPANVTNFSIIYHYAIVLQDPGHQPEQQPRFSAKVFDVAANSEIYCVSFDFTSSANLPGFLASPVFPQVVYKGWTPITVDLSAFAGKRIRLEFATADCTLGGHFGYAYVDVSSVCNGTITGAFQCAGDNFVSMNAPYGFLDYTWYADNSFSQILGTSQNLHLNPAPPLGSVFPVIVNPYPTFGCVDTLYATIAAAAKPVSFAGTDRFVCSKELTQLGTTPTQGYSYSWRPPTLVNNPALSNPYIKGNLFVPSEFIVKTTDLYTSCFSYDTIVVTPFVVDTISSITGRMEYCPGERLDNVLNAANTAATVQWMLDFSPVPGATSHTFRPTTTGTYFGQLRQNGCTDTTRSFTIHLSAVPKVGFNINRAVQCLNSTASFINTTTISNNDPLSYLWKFSDGTTSVDRDPVKSFSITGNVKATMIASTSAGCKDSLTKDLLVMKDCGVLMPTAFTPNSDGLNDVIKPNLSGVKGLKRYTVYNRNGQIVFSTIREDHGWDGTLNGSRLESGVFVWIVEYYLDDDTVRIQKGTLTLIR